MKNIHILPTDKPSRLYKHKFSETFRLLKNELQVSGQAISQNIYITNDEEIKDGEYGICLNLVREGFKSEHAVFKMDVDQRLSMEYLGGQKKAEVLKVILTTDPDLIKDGIQAIPDDFLEWFVKNPSCKEVEIKAVWFSLDESTNGNLGITSNGYWGYKIIIPKQTDWKDSTKALMVAYGDNPKDFPYEEPKQERLEDNTISKERLGRAFKNAKNHLDKGTMARFRASGFLEGILFAFNELEEGKDFIFKDIEYEEIGWFGNKTIKTRKQTYSEFIIEKFEIFLKNKKNG